MSPIGLRILRSLPESVRHRLFRRALRITRVCDAELTVKIAETREELESAYSLLHDCYVGMRLMKPHPAGLRCSLYSALPYTTTIIAKRGDKIVGTVSLIKDSEVGVPSDKEYQDENDLHRAQGHRLVEVSALAVSPEVRNQGHTVSLHLMKYLYQYATRYMDCDMLCATIHPRAWDFYAALLGFKRNGKVVNYGFVQGALAIHITLDLEWTENVWMPQAYRDVPAERDLLRFMTREPSPFVFPDRSASSVLDPVLTPENLEYFFAERTSVFAEVSPKELALIRSAYALHFDVSRIPFLMEAEKTIRPFRYPMRFRALLAASDGGSILGRVLDLSSGGLFFETTHDLAIGKVYEVRIELDGQAIRLPCVPKWRNSGGARHRDSLRHPQGFGMSFAVTDLRVVNFLKSLHQVADAEPLAESA